MRTAAASRPFARYTGGAAAFAKVRGLGPALFGIATFFVVWEAYIRITNTPAFVIPAPSRIAVRLWEELPSYAYEFSFTLAAAAIGLVIGTTIGIIGELFSSKNGIGKVINDTALTLDIPAMFAAIMFLAITGVAITLFMNWSERRVLYWHESIRTVGGR